MSFQALEQAAQGSGGIHHPWRGSENMQMWHFGIWLSRHGGVGLTVGLDDLGGLFLLTIL